MKITTSAQGNRSLEHTPVLLAETLEFLRPETGSTVVDGTLGLGGHARVILEKIGPSGHYYAFDLDEANLNEARHRLQDVSTQLTTFHDNFAHCHHRLHALGIQHVDRILLDLGLSSPHVDEADRGFSLQHDGPLDMRFDRSRGETAADLLNGLSEAELRLIFYRYGEEPYAPKLARLVVERRKTQPFERTGDLVELVGSILKSPQDQRRTATRLFQALRIAVNDELSGLESVLPHLLSLLAPGGRLVVLSYHSLEDRLVKQAFKLATRDCICPPEILRCQCSGRPSYRLLTKKPVTPSPQEIQRNSRSRSAKLRAIERLS